VSVRSALASVVQPLWAGKSAGLKSRAGCADGLPTDDLGPVLDEEVNRLPAKYPAPFVLCCLEGKTNENAARVVGETKMSLLLSSFTCCSLVRKETNMLEVLACDSRIP